MKAARPPKVAESAKQIEAADKYAGREPRVPLQPPCGSDQGQSAEEPGDGAEVQQQRHQPSDSCAYSPVCEREILKRPDHQSLNEDAVDHSHTASYDPSHCQRSVLPIHDHTPMYGHIANALVRVNTFVYGDAMNDRLTKSDWIEQGLRTLASDGAGALKVGPMATRLKVSRGSFYWHFRDIADFRSQVLQCWQERTTERVIRDLEAAKAQPDRLKRLVRRAFVTKRSLERAIRSWAAEDKDVAATVAAVDTRRVSYIAKMLVAAGVESRRALPRAAFMYWAYLGQPIVMDPRHASIPAPALDEISDLFEK
jgi:AcrR family transcriptional regulator